MTLQDLLKARFAMVRQDLDQVLDRLSDADVPWEPKEGMRTIGGLLVEIADKEREALIWIKERTWPEEMPSFDPETSTIQEIRAVLATLRAETYAYIDSLTEAELQEPVFSPEGWWEALRLKECPKSEVIRNIATHEWYHTAQLVTYLWMRGSDPNDW
jgi:uncharacterized damage-inducible protein DinB